MRQTIAAGQFKAKCLQLMDAVQRHHSSIVITKHGKPVAELIPYEANKAWQSKNLFGYMKGTIKFTGDVISPIDEAWDAQQDG